MGRIGHTAEDAFEANDKASVQAGAMGMPPSPAQSAMSTAGDAFTLAKSVSQIAAPGPAPNSSWGNAVISGAKLVGGPIAEHFVPGAGEMVGMFADQAKAAGDAMIPGGTAGMVGRWMHKLFGVGGGAEPSEAPAAGAAAPAAAPATPAAAPKPAPTPAAAPPAAAPRKFPNSPLASDEDVYDRLSR